MLLLLSPGTQRGTGAEAHAPCIRLCGLPYRAVRPELIDNSELKPPPSVNSFPIYVFLQITIHKIQLKIISNQSHGWQG